MHRFAVSAGVQRVCGWGVRGGVASLYKTERLCFEYKVFSRLPDCVAGGVRPAAMEQPASSDGTCGERLCV